MLHRDSNKNEATAFNGCAETAVGHVTIGHVTGGRTGEGVCDISWRRLAVCLTRAACKGPLQGLHKGWHPSAQPPCGVVMLAMWPDGACKLAVAACEDRRTQNWIMLPSPLGSGTDKSSSGMMAAEVIASVAARVAAGKADMQGDCISRS